MGIRKEDEPQTFPVPNTHSERIYVAMHEFFSPELSNVWHLNPTDN